MTFLEKMNLRPNERRVLVGVMLVVFLVLNFWFIFPRFGDWAQVRNELNTTEQKLDRYKKEVANVPDYEAKKRKLEQEGSEVLSEELQLQRIVQSEAMGHGIVVNQYRPQPAAAGARTNQFFQEQALSIDFVTGPKELVDFLVSLASGNSMMRIRDITLRPDPSGTRLVGSMLFVASYQRKTPLKPTVAAPVATPQGKAASPTNKTKAPTPATNASRRLPEANSKKK